MEITKWNISTTRLKTIFSNIDLPKDIKPLLISYPHHSYFHSIIKYIAKERPELIKNCWSWIGREDEGGYGKYADMTAHRIMYIITRRRIPYNLHVRHLCHNKLCVNPFHLRSGTAWQNVQDSLKDGTYTIGEKNGNAVLTEDIINIIYDLYLSGNETTISIAAKYGLDCTTVGDILRGRSWYRVFNKLPISKQDSLLTILKENLGKGYHHKKVSDEDVILLYKDVINKRETCTSLANKFNIARQSMIKILTGQNRKYLFQKLSLNEQNLILQNL